MPLDHLAFSVPPSKFEGLISFLTSSLSHMGFKEFIRPMPGLCGMGDDKPYLWISCIGQEDVEVDPKKLPHIAFNAKTTDEVRQFHEAGLKAGGIDNGEPGPRPHFGPGYWAAFVKDPACGINFECVYREGFIGQ